MKQPLAGKHSVGSDPLSVKTSCAMRMIGWRVALATVLVLLLLGRSSGGDEGAPPLGLDMGSSPLIPTHHSDRCRQSFGRCRNPPGLQPSQIKSQINFDPKLSDPFFESEKWGDETDEECGENDHWKHKARCLSPLGFKHIIHFCDAKLIFDGSILICIHETGPLVDEHLGIVVENGLFSGQFWYVSIVGLKGDRRTWTTKKQKLTLDKRVYHRGDVIKGSIYFECLEEQNNPKLVEKYGRWPYPITIKGVFKTILE